MLRYISLSFALCTAIVANLAYADCALVSTKDNTPINIKVVETDTAEAKSFLKDCINPYTKIYAKDATAAKAGRKVYNFNGCTGCHGGKLEGIMAPALSKDKRLDGVGNYGAFNAQWVYAKNATDKGMFETIAAGTPGRTGGLMPIWHNQVKDHLGDGLSTDEILKVIAYIRSEFKGDSGKPWLDEKPQ